MTTFSLRDTLESGQIFRWKHLQGEAIICHRDKLFFVNEKGESEDVEQEFLHNFLRHDQETMEHTHPYVQEAIHACKGLRILRQDPWECLVTFIVSQNNHQKRIMKNMQDITRAYGEKINYGFYTFPQPYELGTEEDLRKLKLGYRAKHIAELKFLDLEWLEDLQHLPYAKAKKELCKLRGVGPKVADCVLLFSLGFDEACPEDTWIKKIFAANDLTREDLGEQAGLLQQFLFHATRSKRLAL